MTHPSWCRGDVLGEHRSAELPIDTAAPFHLTCWIGAGQDEPDVPTVRMQSDGVTEDVRLDADATDRFADSLDEYATRLRWLATLMRGDDRAAEPVILKLLARGEDDWWRELDQQHALARARAAAEPPRALENSPLTAYTQVSRVPPRLPSAYT